MTCLMLWIVGIGLFWLGVQLDDDIPTIAAIASALILMLGGFILTHAMVQMGVEAIAVLALLFTGSQRFGLE